MMSVEIVGRGRRCSNCGETLFDAEELIRQEHETARALVTRGIRSGNELALVRKVAGLRATEVATMLDVTPETVSRWETGKIAIPRSVAYVVGDLLERPKAARKKLEALTH